MQSKRTYIYSLRSPDFCLKFRQARHQTNTNHNFLLPLYPLQVTGEWEFTAINWPFSLCLFFWPLHQRLLPFEAWAFLPKQTRQMSHESSQREMLPVPLKDLMCQGSTHRPPPAPPLRRSSTPTE